MYKKLNCDIKKCKAECCGIVPIPIETFKKYEHLIKNIDYKKLVFIGNTIILTRKNNYCAFLDDNYKCMIYNDRPEICKLFGYGCHKYLECKYLNGN